MIGCRCVGGGGGLCLADLPHETLAKAAAYLPRPSASLFAAALTAPSSSWQSCNWARRPSPASEAITSAFSLKEACKILDLADVDKHLAKKLSDGDLGALLACIDAKNHVKRLKLTGCWSVVGHGLEPLRGSTVLEQLDLSMVREHEKPTVGPELSVCEQAVLPILRSVVDTPGNALRQLQLPENWTDSTHINGALRAFLGRYKMLLESRPFNCAGPDVMCVGCTDGSPWVDGDTGLQGFTCYNCLRNFCAQCHEGSACGVCRKFYCAECVPARSCEREKLIETGENAGDYEICSTVQCIECEEMIQCKNCSASYCHGCGEEWLSDTDLCQRCSSAFRSLFAPYRRRRERELR